MISKGSLSLEQMELSRAIRSNRRTVRSFQVRKSAQRMNPVIAAWTGIQNR